MTALFPRWTNTALRLAIGGLFVGALSALFGFMVYVRTPWNTEEYEAVDQPVQFDHRHHAVDDRIDCIYCHSGAEVSDYAGVPSTEVCMGCHSQVWNSSPLLEPVRRSYFSGNPIPWNRVHDLPDFVYFNHAVHVQRGVGCSACHGRVDEMARVYKVASLSMGWCLDCHQNAAETPRAAVGGNGAPVTGPEIDPPPLQPALIGTYPSDAVETGSLGPRKVDAFTTCSACHR